MLNNFLKRNFLVIIGVFVGAVGGFLYWKYVGCTSGTCLISSRPVNSTVYGAVMGGLLFSIFKPKKSTFSKKGCRSSRKTNN